MTDQTKGLARSVHTRLVRHAKALGVDPNLILTRYGVERFLYRLSQSPHRERFVLKGALLLLAWLGETFRPTRDADFSSVGEMSGPTLLSLFQDICRQPVEDDGVEYDFESVRVSDIRPEDPYGGRRITLTGHLGSGRIRIQADVGIGDKVEPAPEWIDYPTILGFPSPRLRACHPETVVAEKAHAMVYLGAANSRLKDFHDLYLLSRAYPFRRDLLARTIQATFHRRRTSLPEALPQGLVPEFATDARQRQWTEFLRRNRIDIQESLAEILSRLAIFLGPVLVQSPTACDPNCEWEVDGYWVTRDSLRRVH
jgi:hypothetical protein